VLKEETSQILTWRRYLTIQPKHWLSLQDVHQKTNIGDLVSERLNVDSAAQNFFIDRSQFSSVSFLATRAVWLGTEECRANSKTRWIVKIAVFARWARTSEFIVIIPSIPRRPKLSNRVQRRVIRSDGIRAVARSWVYGTAVANSSQFCGSCGRKRLLSGTTERVSSAVTPENLLECRFTCGFSGRSTLRQHLGLDR